MSRVPPAPGPARPLVLILCIAVLAVALPPAAETAVPDASASANDAAAPQLRVFNATQTSDVVGRIADKLMPGVPVNAASEFVALAPGSHSLALGEQTQAITLERERWYTAVLRPGGIHLLSTERQTNRLKSMLLLYNLVDGTSLSLRLRDGRAVIDLVGTNQVGAREVNAVRAEFTLLDGERKLADLPPVNLQRGRAFSLFVTGSPERLVPVWTMS